MSYYVRMISKAKWFKGNDLPVDSPADAITICSRTFANTLSLWKIESEERYTDVLVALVSKQERVETIDLLLINEADLLDSGLEIVNNKVPNPFEEFQDNHFDIINLSYSKLGIYKDIVLKTILSNARLRRITRKVIIYTLRDYLAAGKLDVKSMNDRLLVEIQSYAG